MHDLPLITTIAAGFAAAWVLGLITHKLGLSTIVGYLLAGVIIGPYTPGFVGAHESLADVDIAHQLAEVGVILLMFGVGLHFHLKDLLAVKTIAIPGAIGHSLAAALLTLVVFQLFGWNMTEGLMLGIAISIASTVVLLRVLMDHNLLSTTHGHVAVGWVIVEDVFTVIVLVMLPLMGTATGDAASADAIPGWVAVMWAVFKLAALVAIVLLAGSRVVPWVLVQVARLRSRELFTLTVLVLSIAVAVGSAALFGASVALGAFLAGMVVGQSPVSHQAAADALPMRDAFAVLFFVSVGMLFDPAFLMQEPLMVAAGLGIILVAKPLLALIIVAIFGYSARTALTVAFGMGQIGEFSFILSQVARSHQLMPEEGHHVLVACAIISITLNPLLFNSMDATERWLKRRPLLWRVLNARGARRMDAINASAQQAVEATKKPLAVIVGYGPVGHVVDALLRDSGLETVIIDTNMDTVKSLTKQGRKAIFGDATHMEILHQAGVKKAVYLVVTLPHSINRGPLLLAARELNPKIEIIVRARYMGEREELKQDGAISAVYEEGEAGIALARQVMKRRGVNDETIDRLLNSLRRLWSLGD